METEPNMIGDDEAEEYAAIMEDWFLEDHCKDHEKPCDCVYCRELKARSEGDADEYQKSHTKITARL